MSRPCTHLLPALAALLCASTLTAQAAEAGSGERSMQIFYGNRPAREADYQVARWGPRGRPSPGYAFRADKVLPITAPPIHDGVVLTKDGLIVGIGPAAKVRIPDGFEVIDCGEAWIVPGIVELHCHIAADGFDLNDTVHQTNPELRTVDLVTLEHDQIKMAQAGGITTVLYIPGSGSNMGGFGTLTKTWGASPEEALVRFPGSLKIAQAGNPERRSGDLGSGMMGMSEGIRATLLRGKAYHEEWDRYQKGQGPKPGFRAELELLRGLFRHEYPLSVHTQIYQVVLETIRQLRLELGLWTVIVHGEFDAFRLCEDAALAGVPVAAGPRSYHFDRGESRFYGLAATWYAGGYLGWREPVRGLGVDGIGVNTDSPVVAQEQLPLQAAMAVRLGLPHEIGLRGITINPARFAGIDHRVGSLEVGKDADLGVWTGDPLDPRNHVRTLVVNGHLAYRRDASRPMW
jgi:imidazolonepropionase-like amidohydrolase